MCVRVYYQDLGHSTSESIYLPSHTPVLEKVSANRLEQLGSGGWARGDRLPVGTRRGKGFFDEENRLSVISMRRSFEG